MTGEGPPPGQVHVWSARVGAPQPALEDLLPADELERLDRLVRARPLVALSLVLRRSVLGSYTGEEPSRLRFEEGPHGKPVLSGSPPLRFNVSHSGDVAVLAVARDRDLGVDVERVRPQLDWPRLARRVLAEGERAELDSMPEGSRRDAFFRLWTCKEAWAKASGRGLGAGLARIELTLAGGDPAFVAVPTPDARWRLRELSSAPGYRAALVVRGSDEFALVERRWPS